MLRTATSFSSQDHEQVVARELQVPVAEQAEGAGRCTAKGRGGGDAQSAQGDAAEAEATRAGVGCSTNPSLIRH